MTGADRSKRILILSPQPWDHNLISKHHYARALAKKNEVIFMTPPTVGFSQRSSIYTPDPSLPQLRVLTLHISLPDRARFYVKRFFKTMNEWVSARWLNRNYREVDLVIDFGCYNQLNNLHAFSARKKLFFPVDDIEQIQPQDRGADLLLTVSTEIQRKYQQAGLPMEFINHGLAEDFVNQATENSSLKSTDNSVSRKTLRVGYSGNIYIPYLDKEVLLSCIRSHVDCEFHFFGVAEPLNQAERAWLDLLKGEKNVFLNGRQKPSKLAASLQQMDVLLVCYKPDYRNYHGENTHKMLEYLSTGKLVVSSHISYYERFNFLWMAEKDKNTQLVDLIDRVKRDHAILNDHVRRQHQVEFALANSYEQRCNEIFKRAGLDT